MTLHDHIDEWWKIAITVMEKLVALIVVAGVLTYTIQSLFVLAAMDWTQTETFYELIHRVLAIIIGLELVRMLVSHSIAAVLELLAFVIARKLLKPDLVSLDLILGIIAFIGLMASRHYFTASHFLSQRGEHAHEDR